MVLKKSLIIVILSVLCGFQTADLSAMKRAASGDLEGQPPVRRHFQQVPTQSLSSSSSSFAAQASQAPLPLATQLTGERAAHPAYQVAIPTVQRTSRPVQPIDIRDLEHDLEMGTNTHSMFLTPDSEAIRSWALNNAISWYKKVAAQNVHLVVKAAAQFYLFLIYAESGDSVKAERYLTLAASQQADPVTQAVAKNYLKVPGSLDALIRFAGSSMDEKTRARANLYLGIIYRDNRDIERAQECFTNAVEQPQYGRLVDYDTENCCSRVLARMYLFNVSPSAERVRTTSKRVILVADDKPDDVWGNLP